MHYQCPMQRNYTRCAPPRPFPYSPYRSICFGQHAYTKSPRKLDILFNILLDVRRIEHASGLRCRYDFTHQLSMCDTFPTLHDPDNSRLRLVVTVRSDTLVSLLILLFRFLRLDLVDLDAVSWVYEIEIDSESIAVVDIFPFWLFAKDAVLCTSKGL